MGETEKIRLQWPCATTAPKPRLLWLRVAVIADAIKAKAEESGVPVVEDPRLAQLLSQVPLGEEIPAELYRAVAEVLVFVMQMEMALQSRA